MNIKGKNLSNIIIFKISLNVTKFLLKKFKFINFREKKNRIQTTIKARTLLLLFIK